MLVRTLEFVGILRKNGLRVSSAEGLDAARALAVAGLFDPSVVREVLAATLVKRANDRELFDELFDLFYLRSSGFARPSEAESMAQVLREAGLSEAEIERLLALLAAEAAGLSPLARMAAGFGAHRVDAFLQLAKMRVDLERMANPLQVGFFTERVLEVLRFGDAETELSQLMARLEARFGSDPARAVERAVGRNFSSMKHVVRDFVRNEFERRRHDFFTGAHTGILLDTPFQRLSERDLRDLRAEVVRLAEKLRAKALLRKTRRARGRLDVSRTLRRALGTGGIPFQLMHRYRRMEKPRLVILCDISDSVRHVSRFMLQFSYTLSDLFADVRSFVFVSDLAESTHLFRHSDIDRAVELANQGGLVSTYANSNYGRAFATFCDRHLEVISRNSTVLVIGDGRNNYNPTHADCLAAMRARAKHLLWLNSESPALWGFGDSAMREYEPHCDRVEVVHNLTSLGRVVDSLVL